LTLGKTSQKEKPRPVLAIRLKTSGMAARKTAPGKRHNCQDKMASGFLAASDSSPDALAGLGFEEEDTA
jgi:hypothetical protein